MSKRFAIVFITLLGNTAEAQHPSKVLKIGWLFAVSGPNRGQQEVVRRLRELGHVEGKTVAYEFRYADNKFKRPPALADELVRLKVDLLVTPGTPGALILKQATQTIPIVFLDVTDPVAAGLVDSLAHPGGNVTGLSTFAPELSGKRLELLKEMLPGISRVSVLANREFQGYGAQAKEIEAAAHALALNLRFVEARGLS